MCLCGLVEITAVVFVLFGCEYSSCVCAVWLRLQQLCLCCLVEFTTATFVLFG